ncbi:MAG: rhodanese-like domain-containing protein [Actinobacteria bacterium]|nr:rhodanese-like domain-containing protein [Actinomycetota bacterium]
MRSATTPVSEVPTADSVNALEHFAGLLALETDCWDVHESMKDDRHDFILLDVRGIGGYETGHVPGAIHMPHADLTETNLTDFPEDTLFVVYCAGPHCNGADKAGVRLALIGRPVKKMIGGIEGWRDEGFDLTKN